MGYACQSCSEPDNDRMVQCDECNEWYHFTCAGVTTDVAKKDWSCAKCQSANGIKPGRSATDKTLTLEDLTVHRPHHAPASVQASTPHPIRPPCLITKIGSQNPASATSRTSSQRSSVKQTKLRLQMQMLEELRELEKRESEREKQNVSRKYQLMAEMADENVQSDRASNTIDGIESIASAERVKTWVRASHQQRMDPPRPDTPPPPPPPRATRTAVLNEYEDYHELSRSQVTARQAVAKDLPTFSGNLEEWPMFLAAYNTTTAMCGFTEQENMMRLQRSLKGKAYEAVKCRLMHPSNVRGVVDTLRMLYGQPEAILHTIIAKVSSMPAVREESLETLIDFAVSIKNFCATVEACGLHEHMYNITLLQQLVNKLPPSLKLSWALHRKSLTIANMGTFSEWLYGLAEGASAVTIPNVQESRGSRNDTRRHRHEHVNVHTQPGSAEHSSPVPKPVRCPACKETCKALDKCKRFLDLPLDSRWAKVRELKLCKNCLRGHSGRCKTKPCGRNGCKYWHHELLHNDQWKKPESRPSTGTTGASSSQHCSTHAETGTEPDPQQQPSENNNDSHSCNVHQLTSSSVLFRYLPIVLYGKGKTVHTYAFLDEGSAVTLIDQDLSDELKLEGTPNPLCLRWTGGTERLETNSQTVSLHISGEQPNARVYPLSDVRTVQELRLPKQTLAFKELATTYPHLRGLPIRTYNNIQPRILIGLKQAHLCLARQSREGGLEHPIAVKTALGWTVCGGASSETSNFIHYTLHVCECNQESDSSLHQAMKDYFSLDSLGVKPSKPLLSSEEQRARHLLETTTHLQGDRYETGLLWRYDDSRLPDSQGMALRRFHCLEKRMNSNQELKDILNQKIADYVSKGYIRKLSTAEVDQRFPRTWYLPVFSVANPNKPKVRMVWDAAATAFGKSLNSALLKGPDLTCSLLKILLQFRERRIGLTGDIREMFHQVLIRESDQQSQRFFWREPDGEIGVYVMRVMTFGACCSPSSAQFVKNANAERFKGEKPLAVEAITEYHYVDDLLVSVNTEDEAIKLAKDIRDVHSRGGFEIRNWTSNSKRVLNDLLAEDSAESEKNLDLASELSTEKVLGMWWDTASDVFTFKVGWNRYDHALLKGERRPTKREVLRVLMTIFDPIGLIAHFLAFLKMLLQQIWRAGTEWDEAISDDAYEKWLTWLEILPQVENVEIQRCYNTRFNSGEVEEVQLHTFVDASENGTAAVVFLRTVTAGTAECTLVASKTRVAPIRFTSIPRLELEAAVLGVRLANSVGEALSLQTKRRLFWTDARDVMCWINSDHRRYAQFVAHRVSEILESSETSEWRWLPSKLNVADDATKWTGTPDLSSNSRWFKGPDFLRSDEGTWPQTPKLNLATNVELRPQFVALHKASEPAISVDRYSNWPRLVRIVAYVQRFLANFRRKYLNKEPIVTHLLTSKELRTSEAHLLRQAQRDGYPEEVAALEAAGEDTSISTTTVHKGSSIYQLTPWLDDNGVMRMRTRIGACRYATDDAKNPVILPRYHHITTLIVRRYHEKYHHLNQETVVNEIRQRFRIPRLRVCLAQARKQCQHCKNERTNPQPPFMADLPPARLEAFSPPFTHTGIDYFGPMEIVIGRRIEKRWVMLATCMTTRAIHLEAVNSLNTSSCIMALRNFMSRRGTPHKIYSDRGTNFIGANRELQTSAKEFNREELAKEFTNPDTEWVFNPPMSPHMGGSWERLIRTVKNNLKAVCSLKRMSDEVLRNLLAEIENTMNSRPLTHVPIDDDSAPALTPNHFLLGSSNGAKPLTKLDHAGHTLKQSWHTSQILANHYWKRWVKDYLPEITRRTKWFQHNKPIAIDDIVVIVDPNTPRNCWPKGRIISTTLSKDGRIRSATVQTAVGAYERPTSKLAVLDVQSVEK